MTAQDIETGPSFHELVAAAVGNDAAGHALAVLAIDPAIPIGGEQTARSELALALNVALFADLLTRVPTAAAYVAEVAARGERIVFDHGALRTIDGETGALPRGLAAFARILEPLGYAIGGTYPLPRLLMTGKAFVHADFPETIPQFFVSELHVAQLSADAQNAATIVFATSRDPLGPVEEEALAVLASDGVVPRELALSAFPGLVAAFGRQHEVATLADYETLLAASKEAAWIATEGNAFNHATTRVPDVDALAAALKAAGKPMKAEVEVSANGRVRQTAFLADTVERQFLLPDGRAASRTVPGSFYEFITRDIDPATGTLDLSFDSGNATGIFAVTGAR
jgi:hypothetical protein